MSATSASASTSTDVDKIKMDVEASRVEVMKAEREISLIKQALRALGPGGDEEEPNSLKISVTKVTGLPDEAKPVINIQLSSPIESQTITQLSDPLNPELEGSVAHFQGVEIENATLTVDVSDADIPLGSSAVLDVKPLTEIDVMGGGGGSAKVTKQMEIAIVPGEHSDADADTVKVEEDAGSEEKVKEDDGEVAQSSEEVADVETADSDEEFVDAKSELNDTPSSKSDEAEAEAGAGAEEEKSDDDGEVVEVEKDEQDVEAKAEVTETKNVAVGDEESDTKTEAEAEVTEESNVEETKEEDKEEIAEIDAEVVVEKSTEEEGTGDEKGEGNAKPEDEDTAESNETPESEKTEEKVVEEEETPTSSTSATATASTLVPTCFVHSQIEFIPSAKDKKDELYVLLNKASKQKASAVDKLRKSAAALNRSRMMEAQTKSTAGTTTTNAAVKAGFLNKKTTKKEPMFLVRWYEKTLGPNSMLRKVYPIAKNYILFFGGVALMHFQGQQLSLPPPV